jgi:hypothetical protein
MEAIAKSSKGSRHLGWVCALFVATLFVSMAMEKLPALSLWIRVPVVLVPAVLFAYFIYAQRRSFSESDELEQKIQLEALSIAYPLTFLLVVVLGQLERVIHLNPEDWDYSHIWPFVFAFYLLGLTVARKRYQ